MNTIRKIVALASLCLLSASATHAQNNDDNAYRNSSEAQQRRWFHMEDGKLRYEFTIQLERGESLTIRFKKISDWTSPNDLLNAFNSADKVMAAYKDSLGGQNTKCVDIHVPVNRKNLISRLTPYNESGNLMAIDQDGAAALKLGMDTLRILQQNEIMVRNKKETSQIQYTFLLKKLDNYMVYTHDDAWKIKTANTIDSIITAYRNRLRKPDAKGNGLEVSYNPIKNTTSVYQGTRMSSNKLVLDGGFGVSLIRNTLCPNVELGMAVYLDQAEKNNMFLRFSYSSFVRFAETSPDHYKGYNTTFVNLELGNESNTRKPGSPFYKSSLGFGYKLLNKKGEDRDPTMSKQMYRIFFNYSINKFFVLTPEVVGNFKKGDQMNSWYGISLNFRFL